MRAFRSIDVRTNLNTDRQRKPTNQRWRIIARVIMRGFPETFLFRKVQLAIGTDELTGPVERERRIMTAPCVRIANNCTADESYSNLAGGVAHRSMTPTSG